ncbi:cytochrome-c peroxidase [Stieleria marina]|uniref:Cytochrome c551 peroxidase n=1 Tax=Stieleria marina TaxID=1930275 RepID=A0A517P0H9_9BACT|nr:Cytochrome c551 peroxidase precursor [Planctomycetes bacterium K23_9]
MSYSTSNDSLMLIGIVLLAAILPSAKTVGGEEVQKDPGPTKRQLHLPETPYNYTNIALPPHFQTSAVRRMDNTPTSNPITDHGATLGRVLFHDTGLSANGKTSCASCHLQKLAFSDAKKVSRGFNGEKVERNSMSLVNSRYYARGRFFWDERATSLEEQVLMPIENELEMGHQLDKLVEQLQGSSVYPPLFKSAFGDDVVTNDRVAMALAQFVRSIVSYQSRYDEGLANAGSIRESFSNFTETENNGKRLFLTRAQCASCHMLDQRGGGRGRGGDRGRGGSRGRGRNGNAAIFFMDGPANNGVDGNYQAKDAGVANQTFDLRDAGDFKSPSLRNVELTAPYMHDGRFITLESVLTHYSDGIKNHPNLDRRFRGGGRSRSRGLNLTSADKKAIVAFLKTLTDHELIEDPKFSDPFASGT